MLMHDFFTITHSQGAFPSFQVRLTVNARHRLFEGHFPGQPVIPGVCLMEMVKEVAEVVICGGHKMRLVSAEQLKFLTLLDPLKMDDLEMRLDGDRREDGSVKVIAVLLESGKPCFKFSGLLVPE